jgi:hypothetical protein
MRQGARLLHDRAPTRRFPPISTARSSATGSGITRRLPHQIHERFQQKHWWKELVSTDDLTTVDGVGASYRDRLWQIGVKTASDLAASDPGGARRREGDQARPSNQQLPMLRDASVDAYVNRIGQKLAANAGGPNFSTLVAHVDTAAESDSGLLGMALRDDHTAAVHYTTPDITADVVSLVDLDSGAETILHSFVCDVEVPQRPAPAEHQRALPEVQPRPRDAGGYPRRADPRRERLRACGHGLVHPDGECPQDLQRENDHDRRDEGQQTQTAQCH